MSQSGKLVKKGIEQRIQELKNSLKPENFKKIPKCVRQDKILRKLEKREAVEKEKQTNRLKILKKIRKQNEAEILENNKSKNQSNKRAASIQVTEGAVLLEISNKFFTEVLLKLIKKELEKKIRILSNLPFFAVNYPNNHKLLEKSKIELDSNSKSNAEKNFQTG